jgi:N-methylhydantoinase A
MIDALSVISVDRGIDPRDFALVAFGGAGGLHGAEIARGLGMRTVLVPPYPGHTSAFGLLTSGLRADVSQTILARSDQGELVEVLNAALTPLRERALATLRREGFAASPHLEHRLEMRYYGQNYHREVLLETAFPLTAGDVRAAIEAFHADYEAFYGYQQATEHVEVVGAIVVAATKGIELTLRPPRPDRRADSWPRRPLAFDGSGYLDTQVVHREQLAPGRVGEGPLVVEEDLSTTIVPPGAVLRVHESGSLIIEIEPDR